MGIAQFMQYENSHSATQRKLKGDVNSFYNVKARTVEKGEVRKTLKFMKNETPHKQNISQLARSILTKNMTLEYEFYEFIKQRLKLQVTHLRKQMFPRNWCLERTHFGV